MNDTAYHPPVDDVDARDSDRQELPDAPDASRGNAPMFIVFLVVALPLAAAAILYVVRG